MRREKEYMEKRIGDRELRPESLMMGYGYDPRLSEGAVKCPVFLTSTFVFESAEAGKSFFEIAYGLREKRPSEEPGLIYSRINNPDLEIVEDRLTLWDGAEAALVFSSGMAAIATTLLTFLRPGDVVVHSEPIYGGSDFLVHNILPQFGIQRRGFSAIDENASLEQAIHEAEQIGRVGMLFLETPANPTNALVDIRETARVAQRLGDKNRRPLVVVDNTFLGPLWQQPLQHGADIVLYSLTKYVGGHSDLIAGACLGNRVLVDSVRGMRTILGTMSDAWTGWLILRSLETMKLRMTSQMKNARYVARHLQEHARVRKVHFLEFLAANDPQRRIFERQCSGPGATFSFEIDGGEAESFRFLNSLKLAKLAVSLGGTETLAEHPGTMTHSDIPKPAQERMGITSSMVRLSIGVEHYEDIIADVDQALAAAFD